MNTTDEILANIDNLTMRERLAKTGPHITMPHLSLTEYNNLVNDNKNALVQEKAERREEMASLIAEFKNTVLTEIGIADHPKADKLWQMAWDNDHSYGYRAVEERAYELSELIKD